jgi:hypothetical protein
LADQFSFADVLRAFTDPQPDPYGGGRSAWDEQPAPNGVPRITIGGNFGTMTPQEDAADQRYVTPAKVLTGVAQGLYTLPARAFDTSESLRQGGTSSDEQPYDPRPAMEAATLGGLGVPGTAAREAAAPGHVLGIDKTMFNNAEDWLHEGILDTPLPGRDLASRLGDFILGAGNKKITGVAAPAVISKDTAPFPQYAEEYPPVGPPIGEIDKGKGTPYLSKQSTPEAAQFEKARTAIGADMAKNGYEPYFDPAKRTYVNPNDYPPTFDTATVVPKKQETIDEHLAKAENPEAIARLQAAYDRGKNNPDFRDWYAMGQLEGALKSDQGAKAGRAAYDRNFATPMAATTGGAAPQPNALMAQYGNVLRAKGSDLPRVTPEEQEQLARYYAERGIPFTNKKGEPIDKTGDVASYRFPVPIGGRYAAGNMEMYQKIDKQGGAKALGADNPKRSDFRANLIGEPRSFTWDEQMTEGHTPGLKQPVWYGLNEQVGRDLAAKNRVDPMNFQDVDWAALKKIKDPSYQGKPMIGNVNDIIERTHRLTGMDRDEIVARGFGHGNIPLYSAAGLGIGPLYPGLGHGDEPPSGRPPLRPEPLLQDEPMPPRPRKPTGEGIHSGREGSSRSAER